MFTFNERDLRLLKVFMTVVESGGYGGAQAEMNIGASTISNHMSELEQRLDTRLCQRGRIGFQLTDTGAQVYEAARRIFSAIGDFTGEMASIRGQLSGSLNLGLLDSAITNPLSPVHEAIWRFNQRDNDARVTVRVEELQTMEKLLLEGQLHAVIGCFPRKISGINYDYVYSEKQELYCGSRHPLFHEEAQSISIQNLSHYRVVSRSMWMQTELPRLMVETASATVNDVLAKAFLIRTGTYIGFLPKHFGDSWVATGELKSLLPQVLGWSAAYYIATRKGFSGSPVMDYFLEDFRTALEDARIEQEI
ncbi:MAG: LysR family transcriptional regulator [Rhodospirillaceae bacterium]|jgi:DNA-binding transcriptional LysR family regulator|nr:MAG: LysR family transcriptional regulator [Rhodospirillaceae bacterium]